MNNLKLISSFIAFGIILNACTKDFLNRTPLDEVGSNSFFKTPGDLKTYMNQFYNSTSFPTSPHHGSDFNSDNEVSGTINTRLEGSRTLDNAGDIPFGRVRSINYFFDHYKRVEEEYELEEYQQYLGEAYFFKALIYFSLLKRYGDIPWLNTTLDTKSPELYKPRDPRNLVADNIIACLDTAALYLTSEKTDGASRVNKWMALLIQSRVALFEGTWEKYHNNTPFGVSNPQPEKYFNKVVEATTAIMNSGLYDIYSTGKPSSDYQDLWRIRDYSSNKEVMFWREYNNTLGKGEATFRNEINYRMQYPSAHSITKSLADAYLCKDGKPISVSSFFEGYATLEKEAQNRDPRYAQTIAVPDVVWRIHEDGSTDYYNQMYDQLNTEYRFNAPTGYIIKKGYNPQVIYHVPQYEETPRIIYRYAEVLLNFAEAKAELGTITQTDINKSIKKLRDRVSMPNLILATITNDPEWHFPDLSPVINEIRRERRVELSLEGFRSEDIKRWAAADELIVGKRPKGFLASQITANPYPVDEEGFLDPYQEKLPNGYQFKVNRDYLDPIPKDQIVLNPELTQNPGWE